MSVPSPPSNCPICPELSWTPWAILDPFYPSTANPMECPGPILPHHEGWIPRAEQGWCLVSTYLLPVHTGHGEMESRLETSEGLLSPH